MGWTRRGAVTTRGRKKYSSSVEGAAAVHTNLGFWWGASFCHITPKNQLCARYTSAVASAAAVHREDGGSKQRHIQAKARWARRCITSTSCSGVPPRRARNRESVGRPMGPSPAARPASPPRLPGDRAKAQICPNQNFLAGPGGEAKRGSARRSPPRPGPTPGGGGGVKGCGVKAAKASFSWFVCKTGN